MRATCPALIADAPCCATHHNCTSAHSSNVNARVASRLCTQSVLQPAKLGTVPYAQFGFSQKHDRVTKYPIQGSGEYHTKNEKKANAKTRWLLCDSRHLSVSEITGGRRYQPCLWSYDATSLTKHTQLRLCRKRRSPTHNVRCAARKKNHLLCVIDIAAAAMLICAAAKSAIVVGHQQGCRCGSSERAQFYWSGTKRDESAIRARSANILGQ